MFFPDDPIWGRVLARHERARGEAFADDSYIYATLKAALQVLAEICQRLWEDAKPCFNMSKVQIYIPGVRRERARELILQHIDSDPSMMMVPFICSCRLKVFENSMSWILLTRTLASLT